MVDMAMMQKLRTKFEKFSVWQHCSRDVIIVDLATLQNCPTKLKKLSFWQHCKNMIIVRFYKNARFDNAAKFRTKF